MLEFELSARGPSTRLPTGDLLLGPTGGLPPPRLFCFTPPNFNSWIRPWTWCRVFHSRVFHPCYLVPRFPLPRFPPLLLGATFSTPAFSTPAILMVPRFPLPRFQSTRFWPSELLKRMMTNHLHHCLRCTSWRLLVSRFCDTCTPLPCAVYTCTIDRNQPWDTTDNNDRS